MDVDSHENVMSQIDDSLIQTDTKFHNCGRSGEFLYRKISVKITLIKYKVSKIHFMQVSYQKELSL